MTRRGGQPCFRPERKASGNKGLAVPVSIQNEMIRDWTVLLTRQVGRLTGVVDREATQPGGWLAR